MTLYKARPGPLASEPTGENGSGSPRMRRRYAPAHRRATLPRFRPYWPLVVAISAGSALRLIVIVAAWPTLFEWVDAIRFLRLNQRGLFDDYWMPAGYPILLKAIHAVVPNIGAVAVVQHGLGVATAVLLYLAVTRLGAPRWAGLVPACAVLFSGDQIFLEHIVMGEAFYTFMLALALYTVARAVSPVRPLALVGAGAIAGLACLTRGSALAIPPVVAVWLVVALGGPVWQRLLRAGAFMGPVALIVVAYSTMATTVGSYAGLTDMNGFDLYGRVAPFADCRRFAPPAGTEALCRDAAVSKRLGPFYYLWVDSSLGQRTFGVSPASSRILGRFARAAILHQPGTYAKVVSRDLIRFVDPSIGHLPAGYGEGHQYLSFSYFDPGMEQTLSSRIATQYRSAHPPSRTWLADLAQGQRILRIGRVAVIVMVATTLSGMVLAERDRRRRIALVGSVALVLYLGPAATLGYDVRYGVPPQAFLAAAAGLGAAAVVRRASRRAAPHDSAGPEMVHVSPPADRAEGRPERVGQQ